MCVCVGGSSGFAPLLWEGRHYLRKGLMLPFPACSESELLCRALMPNPKTPRPPPGLCSRCGLCRECPSSSPSLAPFFLTSHLLAWGPPLRGSPLSVSFAGTALQSPVARL